MASLSPWIAIAALGAWHGLGPANGWMFAAACGVRAADGTRAHRALIPIAVGHVASVVLVALAFTAGLSVDRAAIQMLAGALLLGAAAHRWVQGPDRQPAAGPRAGHARIALWSFLMATAHGAGMMLVPAFLPLCLTDNPAREIAASGSWTLALAAVALHMAAMLATIGIVATGVCHSAARWPRLLRGPAPGRAWAVVLGVTGALLLALR